MRKGRGLMGKDLGKKKRVPKEKETKRAYGVGMMLPSMLRIRTLRRECLVLGMIACGYSEI